ncbi:helix-turn-helix domain-containing protein [Streptomyces zhihengii]|uniref:helix-turn-helix domain-containing protein n=1 Tax=Streptomyces zhihengii TaxID=1818004 RepID=UPI0033A40B52
MTANVFLAAAMERAGLGQAELAERLNRRIEQLTGSPGNLSDRHIRHWLTGKTRWPQRRQRLVLEAEFGVSAEELGFIARARITPAPPEDDDVRRRTFTTAAASFTATALAPGAPSGTSRIGMADADRLEANFARLIHADNTAGLSVDLETRALAHAQHALDLMAIGAATERVRKRLYALAAAFTGTALWAAIDRMEPDRAGRHLDRGLRLARLSGDTAMEMRLWGHASVLYVQQRRLPDAVAAAEMSSTTHVCRRDPLFRSLAAARLAAVHAQAGERAAAHRALSRADAAFHRINAMERPAFVDFYDRAEFEGLAGITMLRLARHEEAEGHLHHGLACLRPEFHRNRVYYSALLATAQLRQGEAEAACATAVASLPSPGHDLPGRTGALFAQFDRDLTIQAGGTSFAADWAAHYPRGATA